MALLVIIDPVGAALIFNALLGPMAFKGRAFVATKALLISLSLLIVFAFFGQDILARLGISIEALRIAGGLLLFYTAFHMITQKLEYEIASGDGDISVYPMSVPLIAGPGSLTMSILLFSGASAKGSEWSVLLAILSVCLITYVCLLLSSGIKTVIGRTGDEILRRFLGVLLAALAIQFVMDGVSGFRSIAA